MVGEKLHRGCGNWVVGERFWDRGKEVELFIEYLDEGAHILLTAQRRIGKTSLMREVSRRISQRYDCVHVDLEASKSAADAIAELGMATKPFDGIWKKVVGVFANVLSKVKDSVDSVELGEVKVQLRSGVNQGNWSIKGGQILEAMGASEKPVVLFFDEVPILLNRILKDDDYKISAERKKEAEVFMSWLREMGQKHRGKIRMVFTGSIGFEPVLHQAGLSATINHLKAFELRPWADATAIGCLEALANQYGVVFEKGVCKRMVEKLGCGIPHHVEMYFDNVYEHCKYRGDMVCNYKVAEQVYLEDMLGTRGHVELSHFEERLKMVIGKEVLPFVLDLLTEAAVTGCLKQEAMEVICKEYRGQFEEEKPAAVLRGVLEVLEHDGYLKKTNRGHVFVSRLLHDWWKGCFGSYHIPAHKREGK